MELFVQIRVRSSQSKIGEKELCVGVKDVQKAVSNDKVVKRCGKEYALYLR